MPSPHSSPPSPSHSWRRRPRGLLPGVLAVLHTWNQLQGHHPHIHCLVTGGGLGPEGFAHCRRYLVPLKILRRVFKGKLLGKLQTLLREQRVSIASDSGHERLRDASRRTWNVDIRRPLGGPEQVVNYFARYTRRIAISDPRLVSYDGNTVVFHYRDRADGNRSKLAKLDAPTFCRRFLQHVLPKGFVRIRRYGLLSNRVRKTLLALCRQLLEVDPPLRLAPPGESRKDACLRIFGTDPQLCPTCKLGTLVVRALWRPTYPSTPCSPPSRRGRLDLTT